MVCKKEGKTKLVGLGSFFTIDNACPKLRQKTIKTTMKLLIFRIAFFLLYNVKMIPDTSCELRIDTTH